MFKKIFVLCACCFMALSVGCSNSYERDTSKGSMKTIQLYEAILKIKNKETFVLVLSQSTCGFCIDFKEQLPSYLNKHNVEMYDVALDKEEATQSENLMIINADIKNFITTPSLFYFKEGKQISELQANEDGITKEAFDKWVQEYEIDAKK